MSSLVGIHRKPVPNYGARDPKWSFVWSHLILCLPFWEGAGIPADIGPNLHGLATPETAGKVPTWGSGEHGIEGRFDNVGDANPGSPEGWFYDNGTGDANDLDVDPRGSDQYTIFSICSYDNTGTDANESGGVGGFSSGASAKPNALFGIDVQATAGPWTMTFIISDLTNSRTLVSAALIPKGREVIVCATYDFGSERMAIGIDGLVKDTGSTGVWVPVADKVSRFRIAQVANARKELGGMDGSMALWGIANTNWSNGEMGAWMADPYGFLGPARPTFYDTPRLTDHYNLKGRFGTPRVG